MVSTKTGICNLALSRCGSKGSVENIDKPSKQTEIVCAKWYDISRRTALKTMMPSFARRREFWALDANYKPAFGYEYAYQYKSDCLKILGIGNIGMCRRDYAVEGGYLLLNEYFEEGVPGKDCVICCAGHNSAVKAKKGSWITLAEWEYSKEKERYIPKCVKTEFVDGERIKEDTLYKLIDGEFVEA